MWSICYIFNNDTDANIDFILPGNMLNNNATIYNNNDTPHLHNLYSSIIIS